MILIGVAARAEHRGKPEATQSNFHAQINDDSNGDGHYYLRTGDLGFIVDDNVYG